MWFNGYMDENDTTTTEPTNCLCGCGAQVARRFKPGHDAKLKSSLLTGTRTNQWWVREASVKALGELGWDHYVDVAVLDRIPVRVRHQGRFTRTRHITQVTFACTDESGITHSSRACPVVEGEAVTSDLATGWACGVCIHTATTAEGAWAGKA